MKTLLAVSGGIDSMCMADMYSREGGEYAVAHCNFHLRGADSDADAEMVEKWADEHGVPFFRADFDTAAYASQHGISIEMAARELRYGWFARIAFENGYDAVAVAHNANDNAETLVLNLLRGTGLRGLCGMSRSGDLREGIRLLRPMLGMSREEIEAYAAEHGVEYREDRTNAELEYKRNRIRNAVFPEFERINPSFVRTLNTDMEHFAQADAIVQDYFIQAKEKVLEEDTIKVPELLSLKHWRYVLFRLVEPLGFHADTFDALARLLEERSGEGPLTFAGKSFLSPTHVLQTSSDGIRILQRGEQDHGEDSLKVEGPGLYTFNGRSVRIETLPFLSGTELRQPSGTLICDARALPYPFYLRRWQNGDWMRPFGMEGRAKKLSDLFTDNKLSLQEKQEAVIIYSPVIDSGHDGHVAAVAGTRMDEALRVTKGSVEIVRISLS